MPLLPEPWVPQRFDDRTLHAVSTRLDGLSLSRLSSKVGRRAAVLIPLCHINGEAGVLFTKRSETVGTHKGHVSFPGGMEDATDHSLEHTALRELEEEIGVPQQRVRILGAFHEARAITGVRVAPYVGYLGEVGDVSTMVVSEAEIDTVFVLTLRDLIDPAARHLQRLGVRQAPVFRAGPAPVWGLTALIMERFLVEVLGAPPTT